MPNKLQVIVESGGGIWVGLMEGLVLFNSPETGSTLALKREDCTTENVRDKIRKSNQKFAEAKRCQVTV